MSERERERERRHTRKALKCRHRVLVQNATQQNPDRLYHTTLVGSAPFVHRVIITTPLRSRVLHTARFFGILVRPLGRGENRRIRFIPPTRPSSCMQTPDVPHTRPSYLILSRECTHKLSLAGIIGIVDAACDLRRRCGRERARATYTFSIPQQSSGANVRVKVIK